MAPRRTVRQKAVPVEEAVASPVKKSTKPDSKKSKTASPKTTLTVPSPRVTRGRLRRENGNEVPNETLLIPAVTKADKILPKKAVQEKKAEVRKKPATPTKRGSKSTPSIEAPVAQKTRGRPKAKNVTYIEPPAVVEVVESLETIPIKKRGKKAAEKPLVEKVLAYEVKQVPPPKNIRRGRPSKKTPAEVADTGPEVIKIPGTAELNGKRKSSDDSEPLGSSAVTDKDEPDPTVKKLKSFLVEVPPRSSVKGKVMTFGEPISGELGLGPDVSCKKRPAFVDQIDDPVCQVACGAMHTLCLTCDGKVYSFGCNDEGALGRESDDESEYDPQLVSLNEKIVKISAGDSHSAALTEDGKVFIWGNFRSDQSGPQGLVHDNKEKSEKPIEIRLTVDTKFTSVASGSDHLLIMDNSGRVYSIGIGEQGQLGRLSDSETDAKLVENREKFLKLDRVMIGESETLCDRIWAGHFSSFARVAVTGQIYAWGLNRESQLGKQTPNVIEWTPIMVDSLKFPGESIEQISPAAEHTLALDSAGRVYSFGSSRYGRLGYPTEKKPPTVQDGDLNVDVNPVPKEVPGLEQVNSICAKSSQSFAVTKSGEIFAWGMYSVHLGFSSAGEEEIVDVLSPRRIEAKKLEGQSVVGVASGSQHTAILVSPSPPLLNGSE